MCIFNTPIKYFPQYFKMAAPIKKEPETSESDEVPDHLNPMSPKFDPILALYDRKTPIPLPDAKQFNNVAEFENYMQGKDAKTLQTKKKIKKEQLPGIIAVRAAAQAKEAVRKAALMAKNAGPSERSKTQERRNRSTTVFTRMESYKKGPLSLLRKCVEERLRVVVVVRAAVAVRSRCRGYVIGFDKHFNMALMDVDEKFIRPIAKKKESDKDQSVDEESCRGLSSGETAAQLASQSRESSHRGPVRNKDAGKRYSDAREGEKMLDLREKLKHSGRKTQAEFKERSTERSSSKEIIYRSSDSEDCERSRSKDRHSALEGNSDQRSRSKDCRDLKSKNRDDPRKSSSSIDPHRKYSSSAEDIMRFKTSSEKRPQRSDDKRSKDFKEHYQNYLSDSNVYVKREQKMEEISSKSDSESTSRPFSRHKQRKSDSDLKTHFQPFWPLYKKWTENRCYAQYEIVTRHVNQLFIRGDNVVSVSIADH